MQLVAGRVGQEFNERRRRHGAFWEDRYHATAVQTDSHLLRCMTYIDLNMVRAGAVEHPRSWDVCGYNEIQSPPARKGVIDFPSLQKLLGAQTRAGVATILEQQLKEQIKTSVRNPVWTREIAVGDREYLNDVKNQLGPRGLRKKLIDRGDQWVLHEQGPFYLPKVDTESCE